MQDIRYAFFQLRRAPGFAVVAIVTLALGIGANTAIYSAIQHLLIAPVSYREADRLVLVMRTIPATGGATEPAREIVDAVRSRSRAFESTALYSRASFTVDGESSPEQFDGAKLAPDLLRVVGVQPALGRGFTSDDSLPGAPAVVLLGYATWQSRFGGTRDVLGRVIRVDDKPATIVGVLPSDFTLAWTNGDQMWTPLHFVGASAPTNVIARLRPGVTVDAARREAQQIVASTEPTPKNPAAAFGTTVMPVTMFFGQRMDKSGLRTALLVLFAAVGVVLLIACANVANLVLARAWGREREFAIRAALGAGRGRLLRLVLAESLLLSLAGGALGMIVGWRALDVIVATRPNFLSELSVVHVDRLVLTLSLVLAAISGIAFGLPPAVFASGTRMSLALMSQSRSATCGAGTRRLRSGVVVTEVALSVVLLVAAGLLIRSMVALAHADTGIDPRGLTAVRLEFPREHFASAATRSTAEASILGQVRAIAGIRGASLALVSPPSSAFWAGGDLELDGQPPTAAEKKPLFGINLVTPDYFTTVGLRLQTGHVFAPAPNDTNPLQPRDVVVSETFARQHWPRGGALGRRFHAVAGGPSMTVVGIVGDVRMPGKSDNEGHSQVYQPMPYGFAFPRLIIHSAEPLATLAPRLITAIGVADRDVRVRRVESVVSYLNDATAVPRFLTALLTAFAALALVLATVGLYGVIAVSVGQRIREIGVRVALGAQRRDVLALVVGDGLRLTLAGLALGIGASFLATRVLRGLLVGVGLGDGATLALVAALVVATAIIASYLPARRATRIDPVEALRAE